MDSIVYAEDIPPIAIDDEHDEHEAGEPLNIVVTENDVGTQVDSSTVRLLHPDTGVELTTWDEEGEGRWTVAGGIVTFTGCLAVDDPYDHCDGLFIGDVFPMEYHVSNGSVLRSINGGETSNPAQIYVTITEPDISLSVTIGYFLAERSDDSVRFEWQTTAEAGTAGFFLLGETANGPTLIHEQMISSKVIDSVATVNYVYEVTTDANIFYLREIGVDGTTDQFGPFDLGRAYGVYAGHGSTANSLQIIYLPFVVGN